MSTHGKNTVIFLDDSTGTPVEITQYSRAVSAAEKVDTSDSSNFGQNDKTFVLGMADEAPSLDGTFDIAFLTLVRATKAAIQAGTLASATMKIGWAGKTTGLPSESREVLITGITVDASTTDLVKMKVDFQRTGATTTSTF